MAMPVDPSAALSDSIPPIVLFADDDPDIVSMYTAYFEMSGLWVASAATPDEAIEAFDELKPNLVVTDMGFRGGRDGAAIVATLKANPASADVPIIVLSGRPAEELPLHTCREADLVLTKPVLPDMLLSRVRELLVKSQHLRSRSAAAQVRGAVLAAKSSRLIERSERLKQAIETTNRPCPSCGARLEWLERGAIGGIEYDYYRWCERGCGLYCLERGLGSTRRWIKLA